MTDREDLVQDLRAHAHEAPAVCAALMRRAANELARDKDYTTERGPNGSVICRSTSEPPELGPARVKGAPCN